MSATNAIAGQGFQLSVLLSPPVAIGQLRTAKRSGSKTKMIDITNTDSPGAYEETLPTIISPGDVDFSGILDPASTSQAELQTLQDARSANSWKIELPNAAGHWTFTAYVSELAFDIDYSKEVSFSGKLSISGTVLYTSGS
jgi:predicted secreted protein